MNALETERLTKKYKDFTLDNVSFNVPAGTVMGLIGENGAGKSTIINIITGACIKDGGSVRIYGKNREKMTASECSDIGTVLADCGFPEELTISEANIVMKGIYKTWDEKKFFEYADRFGLKRKNRIKTFSTGMKMKLEIAIALSHGARLLILDEATNGLDPAARMEMLDIIMDFIQEEDHAVLMSSHIIGDLEKICDYITFIHEGRVVFSENKDELLEKYAVINVNDSKLRELDEKAVIAVEKTSWSSRALVLKDMIPEGFETDKTTLEDIMLLYLKRGEK